MTIHPNARLTPAARRLLVHRVRSQGWLVKEAAQAAGVSRRTAHKWLKRFEEAGEAGLLDRSSRPRSSPRRMAARLVRAIDRLRRRCKRSPASCAWRAPRCLGSSAAWAWGGCGACARPRHRRSATSTSSPVASCTSMRRSSGASKESGTGSTAIAAGAARARAGRRSSSVSTTTRAWPMPRFSPGRTLRAPRPSSSARCVGSRASASGPSGSSRTTPSATARVPSAGFAKPAASGRSSRGPTRRKPTARRSGSSRPCSGAGPIVGPTGPRPYEPPRSDRGWPSTITAGPTEPSAWSRRWLASGQRENNVLGNHT